MHNELMKIIGNRNIVRYIKYYTVIHEILLKGKILPQQRVSWLSHTGKNGSNTYKKDYKFDTL